MTKPRKGTETFEDFLDILVNIVMNDKTPKGDGNVITFFQVIAIYFVMNDKTPKGDGNPSEPLTTGRCSNSYE